MSTITIHITEDRLLKLQQTARRLGVEPEELVRVSLEELLAQPDETVQRAIDYVLKKNVDLYRRLS